MKIAWKDDYSVGVEEIDDQHKHFIDLVNILIDALARKESQETLRGLFQNLAEYAEEHFRTEEKYFDQYKFEESAEHKMRHDEMREDIRDIKEMKDKDQVDFNESVIFFLTEWLDDHLEKMDQRYADFLKKNGLK